MAAIGTGSPSWCNQYGTAAWHLTESHCVGAPGDLMVPTCTAQTERSPRRRKDLSRRQRPVTFHEGFFQSCHDSEILPSRSQADLFTWGDPELAGHTSGTTIASIRCYAEAFDTSTWESDRVSPTSTPELRLDTSCEPSSTSTSPLALVSDFLDTLAGLIHSPVTPSTAKPARSDEAIMIFDSQIFVDMIVDDGQDSADDSDILTPSTWEVPTIDWSFLAPLSSPQKGIDAHGEFMDGQSAVQLDSAALDGIDLSWY